MTSAEQFVEDLLQLLASKSRWTAGVRLLRDVINKYRSRQRARNLPVDGFRPELIAHNQGGQLYRHLQLHLGLRLLGGPFTLLSIAADLIDHHQAGKNRKESQTELLDNHAARMCAEAALDYYCKHLPFEELHSELQRVLVVRES